MPLAFGHPPGADVAAAPLPDGEIHARIADLRWLAQMRWAAMAFLLLATALAYGLGMVVRPGPLWLIAALVGAANLGWLALLRRVGRWSARAIDRMALMHLAVDEVLLAATLHYAGGVDNPFDSLFAFQAAMAAILLPPSVAWSAAGLACALHATLVLGPRLGLLSVHPVDLRLIGGPVSHETQSIAHSLLYLLAHWMMLAGVVYFTGTVRIRQHREEQLRLQHQQLARHHERLARVGAISAGVAHSVRNPLHGALNCLDLVDRNPDMAESERAELRAMTREALQRIDRVTQRLLTLTRAQTAERSLTNLRELLADVIATATPKAQARGVALQLSFAASAAQLPELPLHAQRISEALSNLIDNAVDVSAAGSAVEVSVALGAASPPKVAIEVRDHGGGVSEQALQRIFEPFFTTKAIGEGTGIGLAIARRSARDHGGDVQLLQTSSQGSVFCLSLPLQAPAGLLVDGLD